MPAPASLRAALLLVLLAGCAQSRTTTGGSTGLAVTEPAHPDQATSRGGTVLTGEQLRSSGTTLLTAMTGRVGTMRIEPRTNGGCPMIRLRGQRTITGSVEPLIYVDGAIVRSTCVLESVRTADVVQVEIYPGGTSGRAGYRSNPNGLVLVFLATRTGG
jgi:TonB-dependent receptor-like protein